MPFSNPAITKGLYFLAISFLLFSCTTYRTEPKAPAFTKDTAAITSELQDMVACEKITINGIQTTTNNNAVTSQLIISFVNAKNDNKKLNETGKTIAAQLKQYLQDPNEFDSYKVAFVKKKGLASFSEDYTYSKNDL